MGKGKFDKDPEFKVRSNKIVIDNQNSINTRKRIKNNVNRWDNEENALYLAFIKRHQLQVQNPQKKNKIYLLMSQSIKSRTADQCKTHHVKMVKKFQNEIQNLIQFLQIQRDPRRMTFKKISCENNNIGLETAIQQFKNGVTQQNSMQKTLIQSNQQRIIQENQEIFNVLNY